MGSSVSTGLFVLILTILSAVGPGPVSVQKTKWDAFIDKKDMCLVVFDKKNDSYTRVNAVRCSKRFTPFSTFKVPNALIGLETGVVPDASFTLEWDPQRNPKEAWWPEKWPGRHDLSSAMKYSVVWYFQEIARRVGKKNYERYLDEMDYGNEKVGDTVTTFWLRGPLEISADEQVEFLRRLNEGRIGSDRSRAVVKQVITLEEKDGYRFCGKTGTGRIGENRWLGWMIGFVEKGDDVTYFAFNLEDANNDDLIRRRTELVRKIVDEIIK